MTFDAKAIRRVLVGYDGSDQGRDALRLGAGIAATLQCELIVACVYEPESVFDGDDRYLFPADAKFERAKREGVMNMRFAEVDAALADQPYERRELWGSPARELDAVAEAADVDLIVVGSTHEGKLGRVIPGSVGERLLHGAPCAIAVAPRGFARREHVGLGLMGVGFDGTEESKTALRWAVALARPLDMRLQLIAAVPEFNPMINRPGQVTPAQYQDLARNHFTSAFEESLGGINDVETETVIVDGDPAAVLAEQGIDFDLLVVGSRGYGPLRRVFLGGVSGRVIELAPCPVIVVPRGADRLSMRNSPVSSARTT